MSNSYKDLIVWQVAVDISLDIYKLTEKFPKHEVYGLTSQIRRCAVSVPSNIAEGQGRSTRGEFRQFVGQAKGSSAELETQMYIAQQLGYVTPPAYNEFQAKMARLSKLLNGLLQSLQSPTRETRNEKPETE